MTIYVSQEGNSQEIFVNFEYSTDNVQKLKESMVVNGIQQRNVGYYPLTKIL